MHAAGKERLQANEQMSVCILTDFNVVLSRSFLANADNL